LWFALVNGEAGDAARPSSGRVLPSLIVEGWRFVPHSYAIVNQWQLLALARRDIRLKVVDAPFHRPWQTQAGLFDLPAEQSLRSLEIARLGETADITLRIFAPFRFLPSGSRVTAVFATLEQQLIRRHQMADRAEYERMRRSGPPAQIKVVTPSRWSAEGFYKAGFSKEQVIIVPHGVDVATFRPLPALRHQVRSRLGIGNGEFVFLSIGAMTGNKGIDLLLRGFAEICRRFPSARLVLKGLDPLYGSRDLLSQTLRLLSAHEQQTVVEKVVYLGESLSHQEMAMLYQAADVYVSPYRAEGFNLPVLEAAACGLPVICTRGGPTDDFVTDEFARRIESRMMVVPKEGVYASQLAPDLDHLIALMATAIGETAWRRQAADAGPRHVARDYTWDAAVDTLLRKLLD
jgi:glycosyltransferase involved in cell wall biosynthesis